MDRKAWVRKAIETLRDPSFREIQAYLDEEGEAFAKAELETTLKALLAAGEIEEVKGRYRLKRKSGGQEAFERLFQRE